MMMETYLKKRVEIVIETPLVDRFIDCLDRMKVSGYSVVALIAGRGESGAWSSSGQVGTARQMTQIICVTDAALAQRVIQKTFDVVKSQAGFIAISDVAVLRPGKF